MGVLHTRSAQTVTPQWGARAGEAVQGRQYRSQRMGTGHTRSVTGRGDALGHDGTAFRALQEPGESGGMRA